MTLLLFGEDDPARPLVALDLDPRVHKTWDIWHCRVGEDDPRAPVTTPTRSTARGPAAGPPPGFDPDKVLLDPYAKDVFFPPSFDRERPGIRAPTRAGPPGRPAPPRAGVRLGGRPAAAARLGRGHLRDARPRVHAEPDERGRPRRRGTYAGVVEKIPYLKDLGVTVVELLPVQQFDPQEGNYWGYMPLNFFAPHRVLRGRRRATARREFKAMVKALHAAGIEVILDVVYNHTAEGDHTGPTYSFKGIDDATYYLASDDPGGPTGTTPAAATRSPATRPAVRTLILDSLRYWVTEMHVDGFRFDLASVLARNADGSLRQPRRPAADRDPHRPGAAGRPPDRRALGRGRRLPARDAVPRRPLAPVERPLPRRRPPLRPGRPRHRAGPDDAAVRQRRPLPRQPARRPPAVPEHQLRHLPRRVHALRPRLVRPPPQRGERPRQHRRHGGQPELELRLGGGRRGARRGRRPAAAAGEELLLPAPAGERDPDDLRRRRVPADPGRQQQPVQPGQRDDLARLGPPRRPTRTTSASSG